MASSTLLQHVYVVSPRFFLARRPAPRPPAPSPFPRPNTGHTWNVDIVSLRCVRFDIGRSPHRRVLYNGSDG